MSWLGLVWPDPVWPDPVWYLACPIADSATASVLRRRVRPEGRTVSPLEAGWASTSGYGIASRCVVNVGGGRRRVGVCVVVCLWCCVSVGVCGCLWRLCGCVWGCMGAEFVACVWLWMWTVSLVDWFAVAGLARRCVETGRWSRRDQSQVWPVCVCGWYINSEEKKFWKMEGRGMAMNQLVHKN